MKKNKKKSSVKKLTELTSAEKEAYAKQIKEKLEALTSQIIDEVKPFKCFVILQDEAGHGVSKASGDFKMMDLFQYLNAIVKLSSTNV